MILKTKKMHHFQKKNPSFARHKESTEQIENLADSLESLDTKFFLVSQSHYFLTYCASNLQTNAAVKVLRHNDNKGKSNTARLKKEYEVSRKMSHPNIRKAIKLKKFHNQEAIILEWVEGKTLTECGIFDVKNFLLVATEILHAVVAMHNNCVIHKNLTADHIIVNFKPLRVKIIGCSHSDELNENYLQTVDQLEGDQSYISPEGTGKVNRFVDFRSDFYNIGIIFYYMLAGKLPFCSDNSTGLIDKHLFESPEPLHIIDSTIPRPISDMVGKLMEKNAEDRYQSAKGILFDLQLMLTEYDDDTGLCSVVLAENDFSERLLISQKLYGRSNEFEKLLSAFKRVSAGSKEIVFVSGRAGTGKTTFVRELHKHVAWKKGQLISGKYDQSQRSRPFSALFEAFRDFF